MPNPDRSKSMPRSILTSTRAVGTFDPVWGLAWVQWLAVIEKGKK